MNFKKIFLILIIICFLGLYFIYNNGYYEQVKSKKVILTNEQIEEFEEAILNNEEILVKKELDKNYQTKTSEISLKLANKAENIVTSSIKFIFKRLGNMIE